MNPFGTGSASPTEQLRRLREQAGTLVRDRVEPAVSGAAAKVTKTQPLQRALDLLPLIVEYGGLASQALRWVRGRAEKAAAPALPRRPARHWSAPLRPVAVAVLVLGAGYAAYRLTNAGGRTAALRTLAQHSRPRQRAH